ncbi:MAG: DEAD/DEAH box helicase [Candidatus Cohnella colombiensis]|uniref:DEAD/DEAH box helicase n=1 Tax=Candidatus Cohnella colombiensis TaxID=3121368 RepID=A0AA95JD77_9BACL|nr:MAG: DEAD/DEAH box helicase [Cohnella sp.]
MNNLIPQITDKSLKNPPKLLINNPKTNENILTPILEELSDCHSFMFIVAFVTESGLATLKSHLLDLKQKGVGGRLLTSTYLYFNNPKVFRELLKIDNVEVRLSDLKGFHSKGYIFINAVSHSLIIGSANLTAQALKVNYEWNVKFTLYPEVDLMRQFTEQYEEVWRDATPLSESWISSYEVTYVNYSAKKIITDELATLALAQGVQVEPSPTIEPNQMQIAALHKIDLIHQAKQPKALIISATGTGKTYLSAFDVKRFSPKRMLFIAHREQILIKAKLDYINIIGGSDGDFGILSGSDKAIQAKYLFATIQSISKSETLELFNPEEFDYILIDEVHKAGAESYLKVIEYFKPQFLMGMTATPERTDEFNIYQLFDYNVAYEIRLQEALEEDMLCPFHYFGVTDFEYNGQIIDDATVLAKLVTEERVDHMIEKIEYYGFSGEKVKGLIFCSRKEEAIKLSHMMNARGYRTVALTGEDDVTHRETQMRDLEEGILEYIITVDIFNEGIDIPSVNQVVMLRQTQSSIIFIQQLGRGLRKHEAKEYVTIIDFIGNYKNNYLIPIALSGDKSLNKDNIRRRMKDTTYIKGISTINFEEVAKAQIYRSINNSNLTELKKLRDAYTELKNRIGRVPSLYDFMLHDSIDPLVIVKAYETYYKFLKKIKVEVLDLSAYEEKVLAMLSAEILPGKRKHEIILLELLLKQNEVSYDQYLEALKQSGCRIDQATLSSVQRVLDLSFFVLAYRQKYGDQPICTLKGESTYCINEVLLQKLEENSYFRDMVLDIVKCAIEKSNLFDSGVPLTLYQKYTRKDVCRLLNWDSDESSTMYGYKTKHNTCPIFVTYHKEEAIDSGIKYEDELLSPQILRWFTRRNRTLHSEEVMKIVNASEGGVDVHIFVKKDDDEGSDFYYLGRATPDQSTVGETVMEGKNGKEEPVVFMNMIMEYAVEAKLYNYIKYGNLN